jgi:NAD(P)-dependent dehydrogenase (short-subunit alcohol dehydrogenase family)
VVELQCGDGNPTHIRSIKKDQQMNTSTEKVALITGAAGEGIGRATRRRLARDEYTIVLTDKHQRRLDGALAELQSEVAGNHIAILMDVTNREQVARAIEQVGERFGRLDVLVNNAFLVMHSDDADAWDACVAVNLTGPWNVATAARPLLAAATESVVVNLTSAAADLGQGTRVNMGYIAGKGGLNTLTRVIANTWGVDGVRCNAVSMYAVTGTRATDDYAEHYVEPLTRAALSRFPDADDIAAAIGFLCSDGARYMTGEILNVASGYYMRH